MSRSTTFTHSYTKTRPTIVCLCGSTRFKQAFIEANFRETMQGKIVLSVGLYSHADRDVYTPTEAEKEMLDRLHLCKIDLADEVLVIDPPVILCGQCGKPSEYNPKWGGQWCPDCQLRGYGGTPQPYIGSSTRNEILHAIESGKKVRYLSQESGQHPASAS